MNTLGVPGSSGTGATSGAGSGNGSTKKSPTTTDPVDPLTNKQTFLRLLVAQLKNQNPLNPTDGVQFLSQLTQISGVEQLVGIREDTDKLAGTTAVPQDGGNSSGSDTSGADTGNKQP
jgi:flagellar basal-body rod modification protein FlgD